MALNTKPLPSSFSEANRKLRMKFRGLDNATIEDSIQYARIEYWTKHVDEQIHEDSEALGWLLNVAHRYLYKEVKRLHRQCKISGVATLTSDIDIERQYIYKEILDSFENRNTKKKTSTMVMHALGYSLKELADSENISLSAMKQRHARERMFTKKKAKHLFGSDILNT